MTERASLWDDFPRPSSVPQEGQIDAFDAGWDSHRLGLERATVELVAADPGWATMGWDVREKLARGE